MDQAVPQPLPPEFKNRSTGLVIWGLVEIFFGGMFLFAVALKAIELWGKSIHLEFESLALLGVFFIFAILMISIGIGSIKARRWARALSLILAWFVLIPQILITAMILFSMFVEGKQPLKEMPSLWTLVYACLLYLAIPYLVVYFFRSKHTKATCEARNPMPSWTDRCPLLVLGLCLFSAFAAVFVGISEGKGIFDSLSTTYDFSTTLSCRGVCLRIGMGIILPAAVVYSAWKMYFLKKIGWWIQLAVSILFGILVAVYFYFSSSDFIWREMDYLPWLMVLGTAGYLSSLIWIKKYFPKKQDSAVDFAAN